MGKVLVLEVQVLLLAESIQVSLFLYPHSKTVLFRFPQAKSYNYESLSELVTPKLNPPVKCLCDVSPRSKLSL